MKVTLLFKKKQSVGEKLDLADVLIRPLDNTVTWNRFDCGEVSLNRFLKNKAIRRMRRHEYTVFVAHLVGQNRCIGYFALQVGSDSMPESRKSKIQDFSTSYTAFPAVHLAYLAVDKAFQKQGLGKFLIMNVFEKAAAIAELAGFYALTLQSFDEASTKFYTSLGFQEYSEGGRQPKMLYPLRNIIELVS